MVHPARRTRGLTRLQGRARTHLEKVLECRAHAAAAQSFSGIIGGRTDRGGGAKVSHGMKSICPAWRVGGWARGLGGEGALRGPPQTPPEFPPHPAALLAA